MTDQPLWDDDSALFIDDVPVLLDLDPRTTVIDDPLGVGVFLQFTVPHAASRWLAPVGGVPGAQRFAGGARRVLFWMDAVAGTRIGDVPPETQFLLVERDDSQYLLLVPLIDSSFRASLQGQPEDRLTLLVDSGAADITADAMVGLFVALGADPYELCERAARSVARQIGAGRTRVEKPLPALADQFGWCTWNAFYADVSHEKVREGLESFAAGGVAPRLVILDDGWQSTAPRPPEMPFGGTLPDAFMRERRNQRLAGFAANARFPGDLAPTVAMAKDEFGVSTFLVWHAIDGYWCGVDDAALPGYGVRDMLYTFAPEVLASWPGLRDWAGEYVSLVAPAAADRFFHDYYRHLRTQGVDGVKVDNQSVLEALGAAGGGRVALARRFHEAVEGAAQVHFLGSMINCMGCGNDALYNTPASTITRTSDDFFPDRPESHGAHLWSNALVGAWFGEFIHPDWDMFQSGHPMGAWHAVGRAVSGGPIYVSDAPGQHDFALLRKLVLPDGTVLRPRGVGRPTRDCLFHDPLAEPVLLKIFNHHVEAGVVAAFNAHQPAHGAAPVSGTIAADDVAPLLGEQFAVYAHFADELHMLAAGDALDVTLAPLAAELFTIVPIDDGIAPIGLAALLNSAGAITAKRWITAEHYQVHLRAAGNFLAFCEQPPERIGLNGISLAFQYDPATQRLTCEVPFPGALDMFVQAAGV